MTCRASRDPHSPSSPMQKDRIRIARQSPEEPIRAELFGIERLEQHAESLAAAQRVEPPVRGPAAPAARARTTAASCCEAYRALAEAIREERAITPAAEWLVDNFHIVDEQLREIRDDLPRRLLPRAAQAGRGAPRGLSARLRHRLGVRRAHRQPVRSRVAAAVRARLPARAAADDRRAVGGGDHAARRARREPAAPGREHRARARGAPGGRRAWPTSCSASATRRRRADGERLSARFERGPLPTAFAVQLVQRLREQDPARDPGAALARRAAAAQGTTADEIVRVEHQRQAAMNVTVRNVITEHAPDVGARLDGVLRERQPGRRGAARGHRLRRDGLRDPRPLPARDRGAGARLGPVRARRRAREPCAARGRGAASAGDDRAERSRLLPRSAAGARRSSGRSASGRRRCAGCFAPTSRRRRPATSGRSPSSPASSSRCPSSRPERPASGPLGLLVLALLAARPGLGPRDRAGQSRRDRAGRAGRAAAARAARRRAARAAHHGRRADAADRRRRRSTSRSSGSRCTTWRTRTAISASPSSPTGRTRPPRPCRVTTSCWRAAREGIARLNRRHGAAAGRRRALPPLPPPAALERERAEVDGVGAQARQAPRAEPPAARRHRHDASCRRRRAVAPSGRPLRHHARRRHAPAARRGASGWSARWRIRSIGRGFDRGRRPRRRGLRACSSRASRRRCPDGEGSLFQRLSSGPGGHRSVRGGRVRRLPGPLRRRLVHRQGHLRRGRVRGGAGGTGAGERAAEPRSLRGDLRARRPGDRRRAVRERSLALRGRGGPPAPLGARRLAAAAVDLCGDARACRVDRALEDARQPAAHAVGAGRLPDAWSRGWMLPAPSPAVVDAPSSWRRSPCPRSCRCSSGLLPRRRGISKRSHVRAVGRDVVLAVSQIGAHGHDARAPGLADERRDRAHARSPVRDAPPAAGMGDRGAGEGRAPPRSPRLLPANGRRRSRSPPRRRSLVAWRAPRGLARRAALSRCSGAVAGGGALDQPAAERRGRSRAALGRRTREPCG